VLTPDRSGADSDRDQNQMSEAMGPVGDWTSTTMTMGRMRADRQLGFHRPAVAEQRKQARSPEEGHRSQEEGHRSQEEGRRRNATVAAGSTDRRVRAWMRQDTQMVEGASRERSRRGPAMDRLPSWRNSEEVPHRKQMAEHSIVGEEGVLVEEDGVHVVEALNGHVVVRRDGCALPQSGWADHTLG